MNRSLLWKFLIIVFVIGWTVYEQLPWQSRPLVQTFQENLGKRDATTDAILARAKELQTANPQAEYRNLREAIGTNDITRYFDIDVKAEKDQTTAILNQLQKKSAGRVKLGLDLQGGSSFVVEMQTAGLSTNETRDIVLKNAVEVLRKRVDEFGVAEPLIQPIGENRILIQMPGLSETATETVRTRIQKAAFLEFRMVHPESAKLIAEGITPPGYVLMKETQTLPDGRKEIRPYIVERRSVPGLSGKNIKSSNVIRGQLNDPQIAFRFDTDGATTFARLTTENIGKQMAIILDGELYSAPVIKSPITEGNGVISGGTMTDKDAFDLAAVLQNPLQAPVKIISETKVDPSLGKDTIKSGIRAALFGTALVVGFMLVYYLFAGFIANVAVLLNMIILIGVMSMFDATLTLPGIAGIVLTVGMAVDANVLIFERMREEFAKGKSLRGALSAAYDRAFWTILDSNVTTLIASIILIYLGTGPIKGFGITLTIGIAASMFTALFVTRWVFDLLIAKELLKKLPMLHLIRPTKIDFMRWSVPAFVLSWTLIIAGVGYGLYRGHHMLGVDFAGGDTVTVAFSKKLGVDQLRSVAAPVAGGDVLIQYQREITGTDEKLRITTPFDKGEPVVTALAKQFPDAGLKLVGSERVGPSIGEEVLQTAVISVLLSLLGILLYVAFRYEFSFAVGAVVAIIHDVLMTIGVYALFGRELNATMVAAILTIIGFSINDTIVIFDRIREDLKLGVRGTFRQLINQALNETLSRTIITSGTVLLTTLSLYLFGGGAINDFAFTLLIGIISGTYSTIYIASALVLWWHKGERPRTSQMVTMEDGTQGPGGPGSASLKRVIPAKA
jgi:SecD/SecF fusion protein